MKIALVHGKMMTPYLSGASKSVYQLASAFSELNEDVTVIHADEDLPDNNFNEIKIDKCAYIHFGRLSSFKPTEIISNWKETLSLLRYYSYVSSMNRLNYFDIIDNQGFWVNKSDVLSVRYCIKNYYETTKNGTLRQLFLNLLDFKMRLLLHIEKIHFKNRDTLFIVNCKKEKIALVKLYNVSPNRVYYIPNGHSLPVSIYSYKNRLKLRKKYNLGSKTCLLWVGYNAKRKGLYFFLDYLTRHPDIFGIVAGVSYEEAKKYGLINKNILVLNYYSQIHELFSIADIFYFPTEYEGGAKVVIEAMASGCCVVTTFESGGTDYIKDKLNGFIVKRDQTAMYTVLDDLLKNKRKIRSIGKRAKKSVKDCTWENSARERIKIYSKILKRKNLISVKKR